MAKVEFAGNILVIGFGSIASGALPLILKHINVPISRIQVIAAGTVYAHAATELGVKYTQIAITEQNYRDVIVNQFKLGAGDFLVNLSVDISSKCLVLLAHEIGALYVDTCIEPWLDTYNNPDRSWSLRSNYWLRDDMRSVIPQLAGGPTAVVAHGANPGLVNHFVKRALVQLSEIKNGAPTEPKTREGWSTLARDLGVKVIQISERDTQRPKVQKTRGEFVNTWSVYGFLSEAFHQPSELGWGTHEKTLPAEGHHHEFGCGASIYLTRPGCTVKARGWTPQEGPYHGFLVTHNESIGLADYLTLKNESGQVLYRPTTFYCYHPCDVALLSLHEAVGRGKEQDKERLLQPGDILDGEDELGVLLLGDFGPGFTGFWHGSCLGHEDAIKIPYNQATSLQVTAAVVAAMAWAIENPRAGLVEADEIDYRRVLEITDPYTAPNVSVRTGWTPSETPEAKEFQFKAYLVA